ncbi:MAG: SIS domain-containing protein [Acidobacteriota bacterium]
MSGLSEHFHQAKSKEDFADRYLTYMSDLLAQVDRGAVAQILETFIEAGEAGRTIYFLANGGSAAVASHFVNDLGIGTRAEGSRPFRAASLVDNVPTLTAVGNDEGYEKIFLYQLEAVLDAGDVVVALSVSGNSPNIIEAVRYAKKVGAVVIGCTGFDGGALRQLCDISLHQSTPRGEYGPTEDVFSVLDHLVYTYLRLLRRGKL